MIPWFFFFFLHGSVHAAAPSFTSINEDVLKPKCVTCHSGAEPKGNLDLTSYAKLMESTAVVKGKPYESKLYLLVDSGEMPPEGPSISPSQARDIFKWIKEGANEN